MAAKKYDLIFSEEEKEKIRQEYLSGLSIRDIQKRYDIKCRDWVQYKLLKGIVRNTSEASVLSHKRHPESFLHTDKTKAIIREKRLAFMKAHPEQTAWRKNNEPSYPEKCFIKFLEENGYDKKFLIEREKSVFPFYIDFAFTQIKLAVEIDGSQHVREEERIRKDEEKNKLLHDNGWKVLRVSENTVRKDWVTLKEKLDKIIGSNGLVFETVGIFCSKKEYKKVERDENGLSERMKESNFKQRKVKNRPSLEEIEKLLETMPMTQVGKKFGVTDNAVRKWIKQYKKTGFHVPDTNT